MILKSSSEFTNKINHMKIKKNDNVIILTGKDRGKTGKVVKALPRAGKVVVEGVNMRKKNQRPRKTNEKGQVIEITMPIDVSNVALLEGGKAVRVGKKLIDGKLVRISRKTGSAI